MKLHPRLLDLLGRATLPQAARLAEQAAHAQGLETDIGGDQPLREDPVRFVASDRMAIVVRAALPPPTPLPAIKKEVAAVDPAVALYDVRTITDLIEGSLAEERFSTFVLTGFAATALLLAAVGLYGIVAFGVTERTREIGVRLALGARRAVVLHMIVWQEFTRRAARGIDARIELSSDEDWPPVTDTSAEAWAATTELLRLSQQELRDTLRQISEEDLEQPAGGCKYDNYFLLHGVGQHDVYHQGQIAMLKKALAAIPAG